MIHSTTPVKYRIFTGGIARRPRGHSQELTSVPHLIHSHIYCEHLLLHREACYLGRNTGATPHLSNTNSISDHKIAEELQRSDREPIGEMQDCGRHRHKGGIQLGSNPVLLGASTGRVSGSMCGAAEEFVLPVVWLYVGPIVECRRTLALDGELYGVICR